MRKELLALFGKKQSETLDTTRIPPILREYLDLATRNTDCNPGLLITAWLPFCAVNVGNRVYMLSNSTRIYPNIWSCLLGPSSISRKTTALNYAGYTIKPHESALEDLPAEIYEEKTLVLSNVTLSKLLTCLSVNATRLFVHHELSAWLAEMNKHFNNGYKQTITELYDGIDKTVSNQTRTERIRKPAFSIASSTTEAWIYKNIRENSDQLGGFLQRFIFYVVRDIDLDLMDLQTRSGDDLESLLAVYDQVFAIFRRIPGNFRLDLSAEAIDLRDLAYEEKYRYWFKKNNDNLMSYFTRIYDGYFYKFCIIFTLFTVWEELDKVLPGKPVSYLVNQTTSSVIPDCGVPDRQLVGCGGALIRDPVFEMSKHHPAQTSQEREKEEKTGFRVKPGMTAAGAGMTNVEAFFSNLSVSAETAKQALYLCEFYFNNTIPFLEIVDEQDKLSGERKLVETLVRKYNGKAGHSALLNTSHMRKREFRDHIESLIDREAISVETYKSNQGNMGKMYVLDPELLENWSA